MGLRERIENFIEFKGITTKEFEVKCGLSNGSVSKMNDNTRVKTLEKISIAYPELNLIWVRTGEGEMMKSGIDPPPLSDAGTRPHVELYAAGGGNEVLDGVTLAQCEQMPVVTILPRYDFTLRVTGESMQPQIRPGDVVACMRINEPTFLQWGRIHVLSTSQGIIIKKIFESGDGIRCVSFNPDYHDFVVPKREIYSYNLVVGLIRL